MTAPCAEVGVGGVENGETADDSYSSMKGNAKIKTIRKILIANAQNSERGKTPLF